MGIKLFSFFFLFFSVPKRISSFFPNCNSCSTWSAHVQPLQGTRLLLVSTFAMAVALCISVMIHSKSKLAIKKCEAYCNSNFEHEMV